MSIEKKITLTYQPFEVVLEGRVRIKNMFDLGMSVVTFSTLALAIQVSMGEIGL